MTPQQRTILRNYALATLGAGAVAVSLYFGGFDPELNRPTPITVDGEVIEFTWTDDNTNEDLLIYTDQRDYENGFSNASVYVAVTNQSGVDQDVSLMGSFVNQRRKIKDVSVLTTATFAATSTETGTCRDLTGSQIQNQISKGLDPEDYFITEYAPTTTPRTFEVCDKDIVVTYSTSTEWVALPQTKRDIYEVAIEEGYLDKLSRIRKSVDGYVAENKTLHFPIKAGQTLYYKLDLEYPANDSGNFFLEAVGSEGAYGHLDPWFDANWNYKVALEINPSYVSGSSNLTSFPVYLDLADLPPEFHTNVKTDGCDIRIVESDDATETAFELVSYDATGDTGELHFLADSVSYNATTTFYVYYGNSGASCYADTATYGAQNVWGDYAGVWHFDTVNDSTANNFDLTAAGNASVGNTGGKLGDSSSHDGTGDYFSEPDHVSLDMGTGDYTLQAWVNTNDYTVRQPAIFKGDVSGDFYYLGFDGSGFSNNVGMGIDDAADFDFVRGGAASVGSNAWYQITGVWDATGEDMYLYVDGTSVATALNQAMGDVSSAEDLQIGTSDGEITAAGSSWDGELDEVRMRQSQLSSDWLATEFNNQDTPTPFYWIGDEETNAAGAARRIIRTTQPQ